jgi:hypothetical protein
LLKQLVGPKALKGLLESCAQSLCCVQISGDVKDALIEVIIKQVPLLKNLNLAGCKKVLVFVHFVCFVFVHFLFCVQVKGTCLALFSKGKYGTLLQSLDLSGCELNKTGFKALVKCASHLTSVKLAPLAAS